DVDRIQREAMVHVECRQVQGVLDPLLQTQDRQPLKLCRREIDVRAWRWRDDRNATILAALILRNELAEALPISGRGRVATDARRVLPAFPVPQRHHGE